MEISQQKIIDFSFPRVRNKYSNLARWASLIPSFETLEKKKKSKLHHRNVGTMKTIFSKTVRTALGPVLPNRVSSLSKLVKSLSSPSLFFSSFLLSLFLFYANSTRHSRSLSTCTTTVVCYYTCNLEP